MSSITKTVPRFLKVLYSTVFHPTELKIREMGKLENGWHYGEGVALSDLAIDDVLQLHRHIVLSGLFQTDAFPGLDGEIQVTVYSDSHYFQFERAPGGDWEITHEDNDEEIESVPGRNFDEIKAYVSTLKSKLCDASDFYPRNITGIKQGGNLMRWHSSPPVEIKQSPLLTMTAPFA